ncbi:MAG: outer membrane lipoprotein Blc [Bacteroidetes bacterium]|nr:MAG: outer membrane lipoprotein Blc [Bacteroidota bacterium]
MRVKMLIIMTGSFLFGCKAQNNAPTGVGSVDLLRYQGLWYDIASYPARFQKDCHCTTAEYITTSRDYIKVVNRCRKGGFSERESSVTGKAFIVKGSNNTKLKVQFFWPFKADYWIVKLDPDYKWAVVSSGKDYLWLLSRTPEIPETLYDSVVSSLKKEGYETGRLRRTPQPCK